MNNHENWYETFFDGLVLDLWQQAITPEYTAAEIRFIHSLVTLPARAMILDAPCGFGRHSIPLAQEGHQVTAIDISGGYIRRLNEVAVPLQLPVTAVNADILTYDLQGSYNLALCMGNSFGYFSPEKLAVFTGRVSACLAPGGCFVINTGVLAESMLHLFKERNWWEIGDILFLNELVYHAGESLLQINYRLIRDGVVEKKTAYNYILTLAAVRKLLYDSGFRDIQVYSDCNGSPYKLGDRQAYLFAFR